jgi:hypothetical protein
LSLSSLTTNRSHLVILLLPLALAALTGCGKRQSPKTQNENLPRQSGASQFDVCGLIKNDEMEAIIGSPVKKTNGSSQSENGLRFSQCYYAAAESSKSVSFAVTDRDPASTSNRGAKKYWEELFGRFDKQESEKETEDDKAKKESLREQRRGQGEEEETAAPKRISGIGDEAFWSGNRFGGALYVLKKDKDIFIRVSVGGPDNEEKKIEKSKALAAKALAHL